MLSDLAGIETDHANGLSTYHAAQTANILAGGDQAYDGSYCHARNPQDVIRRIVANHIPRTWSAGSSTSSSAASRSTTPSYRTHGITAA